MTKRNPPHPSRCPSPQTGEDALTEQHPEPSAEIPELLTSAEVEAIFNRSDRTLRDWARQGRLHRVKIGHSVFYLAEEVRRLISDGLVAAMLARTEKSKRKRIEKPAGPVKKPP